MTFELETTLLTSPSLTPILTPSHPHTLALALALALTLTDSHPHTLAHTLTHPQDGSFRDGDVFKFSQVLQQIPCFFFYRT